MRSALLAGVALAVLFANPALADETEFSAVLKSHAILPAATFIDAPADAPAFMKTAAKFTGPGRLRVDEPGTIMGKDGARETGLSMPFPGQAVQGFSGIKNMGDGTFWALSDNGFGNKMNSSDAALMLHHLSFDWQNGTVNLLKTVFLSDPEGMIRYPIVNEATAERYLTGADLDIESIQPVAGGFWIGEEFGPFLIKTDADGKVQSLIETTVDGKIVKSPDHPTLALPGNPTQDMPAFNLKRSGGYEGMAQSKDGSKLYALLEGPLYTEEKAVEQVEGKTALRVIEFDVASQEWTGRTWFYPLSEGGEAIGDFNMIDETTGLVIERDNGAGNKAQACGAAKPTATDCFANPAQFKRVYKIEMTNENAGSAVRKIGYIDLLNIQDPENVRRQGGSEGVYDMPFVTIENVDVFDENHIIVGNDNNLPFSAGRALNKPDDNEFVVLEVSDFLAAK